MIEPLNIAICEDTAEDAEKLVSIISRSSIPARCTVFSSGEDLLAHYHPQEYDLLLTDIYMSGISGLEAVTRIREIDENIPVAFVTTSTDHTLESYRLSALKYIEKPYKEKEIFESIKLAQMERDISPAIVLRRNGTDVRIRLTRILYLEQQTHRLNLYLKDGTVEQLRDKLSDLLPLLEEEDFFVPHKSFAVNLSYVRSIDPELKCFVMQNGKNVPIRRESMSKAKQALKDHLFGRTRGELV